MRAVFCCLLLVAACGAVEPAELDAADPGPDAEAPLDAAVDAMPVQCTPSTTTCDDATGTFLACDASGTGTPVVCPLGCHPTVERCYDVNPSNNLAGYLDMTASAPAIEIPDGSSIDTTSGVVTTPSGPLSVTLDIVPDEDDPYALLAARDAAGELLAEVRVGPDFKLSAASAGAWVADEFRQPD